MKKLKCITLSGMLVLAMSATAFAKPGIISTTKVGIISTTKTGVISTTGTGTSRTGIISTTQSGTSTGTDASLNFGRFQLFELLLTVLGQW